MLRKKNSKEKKGRKKMKENQYKVIGISKFEKDDKTGTTLFLETPFEDWECAGDRIALGNKVAIEFTYNEVVCKPDDLIEITWGKGFQGKAVIKSVKVVEPAIKMPK